LNALKVISGNDAAPLGMADALGKKAKNKSIQSMLGNTLRNIGISQTNARKDQILEIKYKI